MRRKVLENGMKAGRAAAAADPSPYRVSAQAMAEQSSGELAHEAAHADTSRPSLQLTWSRYARASSTFSLPASGASLSKVRKERVRFLTRKGRQRCALLCQLGADTKGIL